jgi:predicted nucleic acid-binding protein
VILVDASVLLAAEDVDDDHHNSARRLLEAGLPLATLDLAYLEVTNVADVVWHAPAAGERLRERIDLIDRFGTLVRVDHQLASTAASIAREFRISGYDAGYVAAARRVGARLASCDVRDLVDNQLAGLPASLHL